MSDHCDSPIRLDSLRGEIIELGVSVQGSLVNDYLGTRVCTMGRVVVIRGTREYSEYIEVGNSTLHKDTMVARDHAWMADFYWLMEANNGTT